MAPAVHLVPPPAPDPQAFARLYAEGFASVWRLLTRLGVSSSAVDDAAHDVFVVAWRRLGEFSGRSSLKTWLLGIAVRVAADYRRKTQRLVVPLSDDLPAAGSPEEQAGQREASRRVHGLLSQLRPERREVFVLMELEELSAPEVAEALGMNLNTVYTRLRAARQDFNALAATLEESSS
jgi:RNA polymerase sigma-70 factor (ECF subfamily)